MTSGWLVTFAPIIGIVVDIVLQIATAHLSRRVGPSIALGAAGGLLTALIVATINLPHGESWIELVAAWIFVILSFLSFEYNYWVFLTLNMTSLRIRTLRELAQYSEGTSLSELKAQYSVDEMLQRRLERLENGTQIVRRDGNWRLQSGKSLLLIHRILAVMRAIILPEYLTK